MMFEGPTQEKSTQEVLAALSLGFLLIFNIEARTVACILHQVQLIGSSFVTMIGLHRPTDVDLWPVAWFCLK